MGLMRKLTSVSTLGAVDYRSDKERIAKNTKGTKKAVEAQTKMLNRQYEDSTADRIADATARAQIRANAKAAKKSKRSKRSPSEPAESAAIAHSGPPAIALSPPSVPAGWHQDPTGRHQHRYWGGAQWTDQVADGGSTSTDPVG